MSPVYSMPNCMQFMLQSSEFYVQHHPVDNTGNAAKGRIIDVERLDLNLAREFQLTTALLCLTVRNATDTIVCKYI